MKRLEKRLEKRLRALEAGLLPQSVVLCFADGTTRTICGPANFLFSLFIDACKGSDMSPQRDEQLDLIRRSVNSMEPGGAHMADLIRCFLLGPVKMGAANE